MGRYALAFALRSSGGAAPAPPEYETAAREGAPWRGARNGTRLHIAESPDQPIAQTADRHMNMRRFSRETPRNYRKVERLGDAARHLC